MFSLSDRQGVEKQPHMGSSQILDRVDALIDDLLNDGNLSSSSLAAILMAARESVRDGYHVALGEEPGTRATISSSGNAPPNTRCSSRADPLERPVRGGPP